MANENEYAEILEAEGFDKKGTELPIDQSVAEAILNDSLTKAPDEWSPLDTDHQDIREKEEIEAERKYQRELDCLIANDKIAVDDPCFEQRASHRRSAVAALNNLKAAVGAGPKDGEFIPPTSDTEYEPAPKAARDFTVLRTKRRHKPRPVFAASSKTTAVPTGHKIATIWDGIKL